MHNVPVDICTYVSVWTNVFISLGYVSVVELLGPCLPLEELPDSVPKWQQWFAFLPAACEGSSHATSSPTSVTGGLLARSLPRAWEAVVCLPVPPGRDSDGGTRRMSGA